MTHVYKNKKFILNTLVTVFLAVTITVVVNYSANKQKTELTTQDNPAVNAASTSKNQKYLDAFKSIEFLTPFYPHTTEGKPDDRYTVVQAGKSDTQLTYTLQDATDNSKYTIALQKKPAIVEVVEKEKRILNDYGESYIANLEGKFAGFIVTKDTMVLVSNPSNSMVQLENILLTLRPLQ